VVALGAGLALEGGVAEAGRLGALVSTLLEQDRYRAAARRVADAIGALPPVTDAVADLEALVGRAARAA
jgi:UDP:flavonoid glycosyltransferase YjiC (YdhE family)